MTTKNITEQPFFSSREDCLTCKLWRWLTNEFQEEEVKKEILPLVLNRKYREKKSNGMIWIENDSICIQKLNCTTTVIVNVTWAACIAFYEFNTFRDFNMHACLCMFVVYVCNARMRKMLTIMNVCKWIAYGILIE